MRIAYVVDVHGRPETVAAAAGSLGPLDLLIVGGDITTGGSAEEAAEAIESWRSLAPRVLAVAGNMDSADIDRRLDELGVSLDGHGVIIDDVGLFGVSAAPHSPLHTPYELPDDELGRRAAQGAAELDDARVRIFCPHAPPFRTACDRLRDGRHVGSPAIRAFVERDQPDLVLCGHIHESRGLDSLGRAQIVNPGPVAAGHYALVEVDGAVSVQLD